MTKKKHHHHGRKLRPGEPLDLFTSKPPADNNCTMGISFGSRFESISAEEEQTLDLHLTTLGAYRKPIVKDGSCLFRAASEQLFLTQSEHRKLRAECVAYMHRHRDDFEPFLDETEPWDKYIRTMAEPQTWGGEHEIQAISRLYGVDVILYRVGEPEQNVTNYGHDRVVRLCYTGGNHYDSVYPLSWLDAASLAQMIVYELVGAITGDLDGGALEGFVNAETEAHLRSEAVQIVTDNQLAQSLQDDLVIDPSPPRRKMGFAEIQEDACRRRKSSKSLEKVASPQPTQPLAPNIAFDFPELPPTGVPKPATSPSTSPPPAVPKTIPDTEDIAQTTALPSSAAAPVSPPTAVAPAAAPAPSAAMPSSSASRADATVAACASPSPPPPVAATSAWGKPLASPAAPSAAKTSSPALISETKPVGVSAPSVAKPSAPAPVSPNPPVAAPPAATAEPAAVPNVANPPASSAAPSAAKTSSPALGSGLRPLGPAAGPGAAKASSSAPRAEGPAPVSPKLPAAATSAWARPLVVKQATAQTSSASVPDKESTAQDRPRQSGFVEIGKTKPRRPSLITSLQQLSNNTEARFQDKKPAKIDDDVLLLPAAVPSLAEKTRDTEGAPATTQDQASAPAERVPVGAKARTAESAPIVSANGAADTAGASGASANARPNAESRTAETTSNTAARAPKPPRQDTARGPKASTSLPPGPPPRMMNTVNSPASAPLPTLSPHGVPPAPMVIPAPPFAMPYPMGFPGAMPVQYIMAHSPPPPAHLFSPASAPGTAPGTPGAQPANPSMAAAPAGPLFIPAGAPLPPGMVLLPGPPPANPMFAAPGAYPMAPGQQAHGTPPHPFPLMYPAPHPGVPILIPAPLPAPVTGGVAAASPPPPPPNMNMPRPSPPVMFMQHAGGMVKPGAVAPGVGVASAGTQVTAADPKAARANKQAPPPQRAEPIDATGVA